MKCLRKYGTKEDIGPEGRAGRSRSEFIQHAGEHWICLVCRKICRCPKCAPSVQPRVRQRPEARPQVHDRSQSGEAAEGSAESAPVPVTVPETGHKLSKSFVKKLLEEPDVDEVDGFIIYEGPLDAFRTRLGKRFSPELPLAKNEESKSPKKISKVHPPPPLPPPAEIRRRQPAKVVPAPPPQVRADPSPVPMDVPVPLPESQSILPPYYNMPSDYFTQQSAPWCFYQAYGACQDFQLNQQLQAMAPVRDLVLTGR